MLLWLDRAALFMTYSFFFFLPYMSWAFWTNNLFMPRMFWGFLDNLHPFIYDIFVGIFLVRFNCGSIFFVPLGDLENFY